MEKILAGLGAVCLVAGAVWGAMPSSALFRLAWRAQIFAGNLSSYVDKTNCAFNIWGSTNLGTPVSSWPRILCLTNWINGVGDGPGLMWYTSSIIALPPGQYFVYLTLTNSNGETLPSNTDNNAAWLSGANWFELR